MLYIYRWMLYIALAIQSFFEFSHLYRAKLAISIYIEFSIQSALYRTCLSSIQSLYIYIEHSIYIYIQRFSLYIQSKICKSKIMQKMAALYIYREIFLQYRYIDQHQRFVLKVALGLKAKFLSYLYLCLQGQVNMKETKLKLYASTATSKAVSWSRELAYSH